MAKLKVKLTVSKRGLGRNITKLRVNLKGKKA